MPIPNVPLARPRITLTLALLLAAGAGMAAALPEPLAAQGSSAGSSTRSRAATARERARERERARQHEREHDRRAGREGMERIDTTVAVEARAIVELSLNGATVTVRAWERNEVRVRAEAEGSRGLGFEASAARVSVDGGHHGDARVEVTMPRTARLDIEGNNLEVDVQGVRGGVEVENASGDVQLADVGGLVRAEVMSGELGVRGGDGDFRLELASGDVVLEDVSGRIQVENVSGDISVRRARARELRLETTSGTVSYEGTVQSDGTYELSSHSGDVALRLPAGTKARLEADTYNGEFVSEFPVTMQPSAARSGNRQRKYELVMGDGTGPLIRISSFTGDITLARTTFTRPDSTR